jgi:DNA-binding CsgD family transcriptional regulator
MNKKIATSYAWIALALLSITVLTIIDLIMDWPHALSIFHFAVELGIVMVCFSLALYLASISYRTHRMAQDSRSDLQQHMDGLSKRIDQQLRDWGLTPAEYNTAILLIKGLSHKEIAAICGRGERTVRQHSVAVYRKAGLAGRAQLSAYFMEDLLPPFEAVEDEPAGAKQVKSVSA